MQCSSVLTSSWSAVLIIHLQLLTGNQSRLLYSSTKIWCLKAINSKCQVQIGMKWIHMTVTKMFFTPCWKRLQKDFNKIKITVHQKKVCTQGCFYVLLCSAPLQKSPIKNIFFVWLEDFHFFHEKFQGYIEPFLLQWLLCDPSYEPTRGMWKWGIT